MDFFGFGVWSIFYYMKYLKMKFIAGVISLSEMKFNFLW